MKISDSYDVRQLPGVLLEFEQRIIKLEEQARNNITLVKKPLAVAPEPTDFVVGIRDDVVVKFPIEEMGGNDG